MARASLWRLFHVIVIWLLLGAGVVANAGPPTAQQYRVMKDTYAIEADTMRGFLDSYDTHIEVWGDPDLVTGPVTRGLYNTVTSNLERQAGLLLELYARVDEVSHADAVTVWARKGFPQKMVSNGAVPDLEYFIAIGYGNFARLEREAIVRAEARNPGVESGVGRPYEGLHGDLDRGLKEFLSTFSELVNRLVQLSVDTSGPGVVPEDEIGQGEYMLQARARDVVSIYDRVAALNRRVADSALMQTVLYGYGEDLSPRFHGLSLAEIRGMANGDFTPFNKAVDSATRFSRAASLASEVRGDPDPPSMGIWFTRFYEQVSKLSESEKQMLELFRDVGTDIESLSWPAQQAYGRAEFRRQQAAESAAGALDRVSEYYPALADSLETITGRTRPALEKLKLFNTGPADYLVRRMNFASRDFSDLSEGDAVRILESSVEKAYMESLKASAIVVGMGQMLSDLDPQHMTTFNKYQFRLYKKRKAFQELFAEYERVAEGRATKWLATKVEMDPIDLTQVSYSRARMSGSYPDSFSVERITRIGTYRSALEVQLKQLKITLDQMREIKEMRDPLFQKNAMLQFEGKQPGSDDITALANLKRRFGVLSRQAGGQDYIIQETRDNLFALDAEGGSWLWNLTSDMHWPRLDEQLHFTAQGSRPPPDRSGAVTTRPVDALGSAVGPYRPVDPSGRPFPEGSGELPSQEEVDLARLLDRSGGLRSSGEVRYSNLLDRYDSIDREVDLRYIGSMLRSLENAEIDMRTFYRHNSRHISSDQSGRIAETYKSKVQKFNDLAQDVETDVSTFLAKFADEHNFADLYDVGFGALKVHFRYAAEGSVGPPVPFRLEKSPSDYAVSPRPGSSATSQQVQVLRDKLSRKVREAEGSVDDALARGQELLEIYTRKDELSIDEINARVGRYNQGIREVVGNRQRLFIHMDDLARVDGSVLDFVSQEDLIRSRSIWKQMPTADEMLRDDFGVTLESIIRQKGNAGLSEEFRIPDQGDAGGGVDGVVGALESKFGGQWFGASEADVSLSEEQFTAKGFADLFDLVARSRESLAVHARLLESDRGGVSVDSGYPGFVRQAWNEERFKLEFVYKPRLVRMTTHAMRHSAYFRDSDGGFDVRKLGGLLSGLMEEQPVEARAYLLPYTGFEFAGPDWVGPVFRLSTGGVDSERVSRVKFGGITRQSEPLSMPPESDVSYDIVQARTGYMKDREVYIDAVDHWTSGGGDKLRGRSALFAAREEISGAMARYLDARRQLFSLDPNAAVWAGNVGNASELPEHSYVDEVIFAGRGGVAELAVVEPDIDTPDLLRIEADVVSGGESVRRVSRFELPRSGVMDRIRRSMAFADRGASSDVYVLENDPLDSAGDLPPGATSSDYYSTVPVGGRGSGVGVATGGRADDPYSRSGGVEASEGATAEGSGPYSTPGSGGGQSGPGYHVLDRGGDSSPGQAVPGDRPGGGRVEGPYEKIAVGSDQVAGLGLDGLGRVVDPVLGRPPLPPRRSGKSVSALDMVSSEASVSGSVVAGGGPGQVGVMRIEDTLGVLESVDERIIGEYRAAALERLMEAYRGSFYMRDGSAVDLGAARRMPEFGSMASEGYIKYLEGLVSPTWADQSSALSGAYGNFVQFDQEVANSPPSAGANAPERFYAYSSPDSPRAAWRASPRFGEDIGIGDTFVSADTMIVDNSPFGLARASAEVLKSGGGDGRLVVYEILNEDFGQFGKVAAAGEVSRSRWGLKKKPTINPDELGGGVARSLAEKLSRLRASKEGGVASGHYISELRKVRGRQSGMTKIFRSIRDGVFRTGHTASGGIRKATTELEDVPDEVYGPGLRDELAFVSVDKSGFTRGTAFEVMDIQEVRSRFRFYRQPLEYPDEKETLLGGKDGLIGFNEPLEVKRVILRPRRSVNSGERVWVSRNRGSEGPRKVSVDVQWSDLDALGVKKNFKVHCN